MIEWSSEAKTSISMLLRPNLIHLALCGGEITAYWFLNPMIFGMWHSDRKREFIRQKRERIVNSRGMRDRAFGVMHGICTRFFSTLILPFELEPLYVKQCSIEETNLFLFSFDVWPLSAWYIVNYHPLFSWLMGAPPGITQAAASKNRSSIRLTLSSRLIWRFHLCSRFLDPDVWIFAARPLNHDMPRNMQRCSCVASHLAESLQ